MADTEKFITQLQTGPRAELVDTLDDQPRRMNTFLSQPAPHGEEQWMPMHFAAQAGHSPALDALLERGVHPDCRTRYRTPMHARQTPLHLAAAGGHAQAIRRLLEAGAEVEVRDALGRSPLWLAARQQHADVVTQLVRRGADPDAPDGQGRAPLHASLMVHSAPSLVQSTGTSLPASDRQGSVFDPAAALA
ncbi:MAG: ankyrin repeat domain-containing protein, partial [Planctomycetota bacterium]